MTEPMAPERLDEIRTAAARWLEGDLKNPTTTSVFRHRAELLVEVDRLRARADHLQRLADERAATILELSDDLDKAGVER
ncbi:MAG TPA: hypothetical protein VGS97_20110 [Actinocrinis sp.]|uniref:hypothetical protein n=1 Tax=Actinocrinis sp. TaxID=1920516 RepID=UPI002DDD566C|nr:hypothetical protein [Actinocrinis sp.]HEV2346414.1 hypothetical protein [Actinocrinis sp.]